MNVLNSLAPVFLIIALGALLYYQGLLRSELFKTLNGLAYYVGLPCLLFYKTASATGGGESALRVSFVMVAATLGLIALAFLVARILRIPRDQIGTFVETAHRGNVAYVGLPVILYAVAEPMAAVSREAADSIGTVAILALAPLIIVYNVLAVFIVLTGGDKRPGFGTLLRQVLTNPLVIACALGGLWHLTARPLPVVVTRTCVPLGQMALPLALLRIGASMVSMKIGRGLAHALPASILNVAVAPILGYFVAHWFGLGPDELKVALLYLACPISATCFIVICQLGGDEELAANSVVVSTVLAIFSLSFVLWFLG